MQLVVLTFAGRECYLRILFPLILKYKKYISEYRLYIATTIKSDIDYMQNFADENDFVKIVDFKINNSCEVWNRAYTECVEKDTVYLKLDDDILYFDETLFTDFIKYRIENKNPPLLYPVIINNYFISWMLQKKGSYIPSIKSNIGNDWKIYIEDSKNNIINNKNNKISIGDFIPHNKLLCPVAWGNIKYCYDLHNQFLQDLSKGDITKYHFDKNIILSDYQAVSINACAWLGEDLNQLLEKYKNTMTHEDEAWWSIYIPLWENRPNEIYGKCVVGHYAYYIQRERGIDNTDILQRYFENMKSNN